MYLINEFDRKLVKFIEKLVKFNEFLIGILIESW